MSYKRVVEYRVAQARRVLECAIANDDVFVASVCRRVTQAWLLGRRVAQADLDLVAAFDPRNA